MLSITPTILTTPIKGYEGLYRITNDGDIYSIKTRRRVKTNTNSVKLYKDGKCQHFSVPRLIMTNFLDFYPDDSYYVKKSRGMPVNLRYMKLLKRMDKPIKRIKIMNIGKSSAATNLRFLHSVGDDVYKTIKTFSVDEIYNILTLRSHTVFQGNDESYRQEWDDMIHAMRMLFDGAYVYDYLVKNLEE